MNDIQDKVQHSGHYMKLTFNTKWEIVGKSWDQTLINTGIAGVKIIVQIDENTIKDIIKLKKLKETVEYAAAVSEFIVNAHNS